MRPTREDRGAAIVEFVMMAGLLIFLLFSVLQIAMLCYARNVVSASAFDGARLAAAAGVDPARGAQRAHDMIARGLTGGVAASVPCTSEVSIDLASGLPVSVVRCRGRLHLAFVPVPAPMTIDVTASALREGVP